VTARQAQVLEVMLFFMVRAGGKEGVDRRSWA